jgi:hypothetical protein
LARPNIVRLVGCGTIVAVKASDPPAGLLLIAVAALLAGRRDQLGIVRWGRQLSEQALASLGITPRACASALGLVRPSHRPLPTQESIQEPESRAGKTPHSAEFEANPRTTLALGAVTSRAQIRIAGAGPFCHRTGDARIFSTSATPENAFSRRLSRR